MKGDGVMFLSEIVKMLVTMSESQRFSVWFRLIILTLSESLLCYPNLKYTPYCIQ